MLRSASKDVSQKSPSQCETMGYMIVLQNGTSLNKLLWSSPYYRVEHNWINQYAFRQWTIILNTTTNYKTLALIHWEKLPLPLPYCTYRGHWTHRLWHPFPTQMSPSSQSRRLLTSAKSDRSSIGINGNKYPHHNTLTTTKTLIPCHWKPPPLFKNRRWRDYLAELQSLPWRMSLLLLLYRTPDGQSLEICSPPWKRQPRSHKLQDSIHKPRHRTWKGDSFADECKRQMESNVHWACALILLHCLVQVHGCPL